MKDTKLMRLLEKCSYGFSPVEYVSGMRVRDPFGGRSFLDVAAKDKKFLETTWKASPYNFSQ